jgi:homoserine/homoserine lactone efflux protein
MDLAVWLTYLLATIILSVTPGPGGLLEHLERSPPRFGAASGMPSGCRRPNLVYVVVVALGLGAISSPPRRSSPS